MARQEVTVVVLVVEIVVVTIHGAVFPPQWYVVYLMTIFYLCVCDVVLGAVIDVVDVVVLVVVSVPVAFDAMLAVVVVAVVVVVVVDFVFVG